VYTLPTLEDMHGFLIALMRALLPGRDVSRWSFNWKFLRVIAGAVTDIHAHIQAAVRDLMPDTAEGDGLDALTVVGAVGAAVPLGAELVHDSGLRFETNEATVIPAAGRIDVDVVAIDVGSATRLNAGETLTFTTPPPGLEETAELALDLDEDGTDVESDGAYRLRILSRLSSPPLGGSQEDFRQWALETTGIADAYVYPNRAGLGTVDIAAVHAGTGTARVLTVGEVADLQAAIDEERPVGAKATRVLTVVPETVDVTAGIVPNGAAQYDFDWEDSTPPIVASWNAGTRTLTLTLDRPATLKAGDRVILSTALGTGEQYVVESLPVTATQLVLEDAPAAPPLAADLVYSGGPLVDPVRDALLAHINGLGTANPDTHRYGSWEGSIRPAAIMRVASAVPGVLDVPPDGVTPAATVEADDPPYPDDDTIGLLIPGRVIVRRYHGAP
jgi:uncharacterized phage protein gp47/JayE